MLAGENATMVRFPAAPLDGFGFQSLTPADFDGALAAPPGSPAFLLRHVDDEAHDPGGASPASDHLDVYELRADFVAPAFSFERVQSIPIAEFSSNLCGLVATGGWRGAGEDALRARLAKLPALIRTPAVGDFWI